MRVGLRDHLEDHETPIVKSSFGHGIVGKWTEALVALGIIMKTLWTPCFNTSLFKTSFPHYHMEDGADLVGNGQVSASQGSCPSHSFRSRKKQMEGCGSLPGSTQRELAIHRQQEEPYSNGPRCDEPFHRTPFGYSSFIVKKSSSSS